MLLPSKHIKVSESILALSGNILKFMDVPLKLEELRQKIEQYNSKTEPKILYHNLDNLILALSFLYSINVIDINTEGQLIKCD